MFANQEKNEFKKQLELSAQLFKKTKKKSKCKNVYSMNISSLPQSQDQQKIASIYQMWNQNTLTERKTNSPSNSSNRNEQKSFRLQKTFKQSIEKLRLATEYLPQKKNTNFQYIVTIIIISCIKTKEELKEEILSLKNNLNNLKNENFSLRTTNLALLKEINKFERMISLDTNQLLEQNATQHQFFKTTSAQSKTLLLNLKKQIYTLKCEAREKNEILEKLKKQIKITKQQEAQVEIEELKSETNRLRKMLEIISAKQLNSLSIDNQSCMKTIQTENLELQMQFEFQQQQINQFKKKITELNLLTKQQLQKLVYQKQQLSEKENQIQSFLLSKLQNQNELHKTNISKKDTQEQNSCELQQKLEIKDAKISLLEKNLNNKKNEIDERERQNFELKAKFQSQINEILNHKHIIEQKCEYQRNQYKQLIEKYNQILTDQKNMICQPTAQSMNSKTLEQENQFKIDKRYVPRIKKVELNDLLQILRFNIKRQRISLEQIDKYLFSEDEREQQIVLLSNLMDKLSQNPFNITNQKQLLLIARFLIEGQDEDYIQIDLQRTQDLNIVNSIFKQLIGKIQIISLEEEQKICEQISFKLNPQKQSIIDFINSIIKQRTKSLQGPVTLVTMQEMQQAFKQFDIYFTNEELEIFQAKTFASTENIQLIDFKQIFKIFPQLQNISNTEFPPEK